MCTVQLLIQFECLPTYLNCLSSFVHCKCIAIFPPLQDISGSLTVWASHVIDCVHNNNNKKKIGKSASQKSVSQPTTPDETYKQKYLLFFHMSLPRWKVFHNLSFLIITSLISIFVFFLLKKFDCYTIGFSISSRLSSD